MELILSVRGELDKFDNISYLKKKLISPHVFQKQSRASWPSQNSPIKWDFVLIITFIALWDKDEYSCKISYQKSYNLGRYNNSKLKLGVEVESGEFQYSESRVSSNWYLISIITLNLLHFGDNR